MASRLFVLQFSEDPVKVGKAGPVARLDNGGGPCQASRGRVLLTLHRAGEGMVGSTYDCPVPPL
jgi:hypothetical protein